MHETIVIGPAADAVEPGFEQTKFAIPKLGVEVFQQKHGRNFFLQHGSTKQLIGYREQEIEILLTQNFPPTSSHRPAQRGRIPSVRFDFFFEEPLHTGSVLGGTAVFENAPDSGGNSLRTFFTLLHVATKKAAQ